MGSRSNVVLILESKIEKRFQSFRGENRTGRKPSPGGATTCPALWLYSHSGGEYFRDDLAAIALKTAEPRWDDPEYMARIFIDSIFADYRDKETGGGIGFGPADNSNDVRVIHLPTGMTWLVDGRTVYSAEWDNNSPVPGSTQTFDEFCKDAEPRSRRTPW